MALAPFSTPSPLQPHEALWVLRPNLSAVTCCAFYPTNGVSLYRSSSPRSIAPEDAPSSFEGASSAELLNGGDRTALLPTTLFLTGDVDGVCMLWDMHARKCLLSFHPSPSTAQPKGVLSVGFFPSEKHFPLVPSDSCEKAGPMPCGEISALTHSSGSAPFSRPFSLRHRSRSPHGTSRRGYCRRDFTGPYYPLFFFTHCRDKHVYLWRYLLPLQSSEGQRPCSGAPVLLATVEAPQEGYCPVSCAYAYQCYVQNHPSSCADLPQRHLAVRFTSYFAIPVGGGRLCLWSAVVQQERSSTATLPAGARLSALSLYPFSSRRSACGEGETENARAPISVYRFSPDETEKKKEIVRHEGGAAFDLADSFKGGLIMCLHMCRDACSLAAGFESGHVVLFCYRSPHCPPSRCTGVHPRFHSGTSQFKPFIVGVLRLFSEVCLSCAWVLPDSFTSLRRSSNEAVEEKEESVVVAGSAEGVLQSYGCCLQAGAAETDRAPPEAWALRWAHKLPSGISQVRVASGMEGGRGGVVLASCWDSTVRLFELSSGKCLTILTQHMDSVNDVVLLGDTLGWYPGGNQRFWSIRVPPHSSESMKEEGPGKEEEYCTVNTLALDAEQAATVERVLQEETRSLAAVIGFDVRASRRQQRREKNEGGKKPKLVEGSGVEEATNAKCQTMQSGPFVFASASKDHTVGVWSVDFSLVGS